MGRYAEPIVLAVTLVVAVLWLATPRQESVSDDKHPPLNSSPSAPTSTPRKTTSAPIIITRSSRPVDPPEPTPRSTTEKLGDYQKGVREFGELTATNMVHQLRTALAIDDDAHRQDMLQRLAQYVMHEPATAQAVFKQVVTPSKSPLSGAIINAEGMSLSHAKEVAAAFAAIDFEATAQWALDTQTVLFSQTVDHWLDNDIAVSERWISNLPGSQRMFPTAALLVAWQKRDPTAAGEWAQRLARSGSNHYAHGPLAAAWAHNDRDGASAWALSLRDSEQRAALDGIAKSVATTDIEQAVSWIETIPAGSTRTFALQTIAAEMLKKDDPAAIVHWLDTLPDLKTAQERTPLYSAVSRWTTNEPQAAAQWALNHTDVAVTAEMVPRVASAWAQQTPRAAAEWVEGIMLEDGSIRNKAIVNAVTIWIEQDRQRALEWLETVDVPEHRRKQLLAIRARP